MSLNLPSWAEFLLNTTDNVGSVTKSNLLNWIELSLSQIYFNQVLGESLPLNYCVYAKKKKKVYMRLSPASGLPGVVRGTALSLVVPLV